MSAPKLHVVRPLLALANAEKRLTRPEPRDFSTDRWIRGEGPRFWTVERVAELKALNEQLRSARKARK